MKRVGLMITVVLLLQACAANTEQVNQLKSRSIDRQLEQISVSTNYNTFITVNKNAVLEYEQSNTGVLSGMTLAIKDNIDVAGLPTTGGTEVLKDNVPTTDATVVARLKTAGAVIIGKTNLHELAFGITSNNATYGPVKNAINPNYLPGGSSGGTGVAVALGLADAGLGTDTGGSSRIPAALNGIVGFRPTTGRYPNDGMLMISNTRDTAGPMGRSVGDVALLDAVMSGTGSSVTEVDLSTIRLGVPEEYFYADLDPDVERVTTATLEKLEQAGVTLVKANLANIAKLNEIGFPIVFYETARTVPEYLATSGGGISMQVLQEGVTSPDVKGAIDMIMTGPITDAQYREAIDIIRPQLQKLYADYFSQHQVDAVIYPTTPLPARLRENSDETVELNGKQVPTFPTYIRNVDPSSNAGIPSISLPAGFSSRGLPIGMALDGAIEKDRQLLDLAAAIEALLNP